VARKPDGVADIVLTPVLEINGDEFRGLVSREAFYLFRNGIRVTGEEYPDLFIQYLEHSKNT
jgi:hypothetical protein